jgi:hypothetical protein
LLTFTAARIVCALVVGAWLALGIAAQENSQSPRQVVDPARGPAVRGRALSNGVPVRDAVVRAWRKSLVRFAQRDGGAAFDERDWYGMRFEGAMSPSDVLGAPEVYSTDADGRFSVPTFGSGELRIEIVSRAGARRALDPLTVDGASSLELGDVGLRDGCSLHGKLRVPDGTSPRGLKLELWNFGRARDLAHRAEIAIVDERGEFAFECLTAGPQHLYVDEQPGVLARGGEYAFDLEPGEQREMVLDVRDRAGCQVQARVTVNGEPAQDVSIALRSIASPNKSARLERTDEGGEVGGWGNAIGPADAELFAPSRMPIGRFARVADLASGASVAFTIDAQCGKLALRWPALPPGETLDQVALESNRTGAAHPYAPVFVADPLGAAADVRATAANACEFAWVAPGEYEWRVRVLSRKAHDVCAERYYRAAVTIRAGETTECVLTEADRTPQTSSVFGRVLLDGQPVPHAEINLWSESLVHYFVDQDGGEPARFDENDSYWDATNGPTALAFSLGAPSKQHTDADGRFAILALASVDYRFEILGPGGARKSIDPIAVAADRPTDLGDIELEPGSTLSGKVLLPVGVDPTTVTLSCWVFARETHVQLESDATFHLAGLHAGVAHVHVEGAAGLLPGTFEPPPRLIAGGSSEIVIDMRDHASCNAALVVRVNGRPARGVWARLNAADKSDCIFESTDASGVTMGRVLAMGLADVQLIAASGMSLGHFERRLDLVAGTTSLAEIDVACGALELEWPRLAGADPLYGLRIAVKDSDGATLLHANAHAGKWDTKPDSHIVGDQRARFDWLPIGTHEWLITVETLHGDEVRVQSTFRKTLTIRPDETTGCVLTERDRAKVR